MKILNEKMIVTLSVEELKNVVGEVITTSITSLPKFESTATDRGLKLIGLRELKNYVGCGINTAQKLKDEGRVPYSQIGNRFYFYSNEVDEALRIRI
jgi:hypothetical protein